MKTRIESYCDNRVTITWRDGTHTTYRAPLDGGYVTDDGSGKQVCKRLGRFGDTLYWGGHVPLVELIRREYRALRRAEVQWGVTFEDLRGDSAA